MEPSHILIKNNSLSLRCLGPIGEGGDAVRLLPGESKPVSIDLLSKLENNPAFIAAFECKDLEIVGESKPVAPALPLEFKPAGDKPPVVSPDDLLNS